jgi:hypothetical protein
MILLFPADLRGIPCGTGPRINVCEDNKDPGSSSRELFFPFRVRPVRHPFDANSAEHLL